MSWSVTGSRIEVVTATWPARCRTTSNGSSRAARSAPASRTSPSMKRTSGCTLSSHARLKRDAGRTKLSKTTTSWPSSRNRRAALEPMKPAPPVIRKRMRVLSHSFYRRIGAPGADEGDAGTGRGFGLAGVAREPPDPECVVHGRRNGDPAAGELARREMRQAGVVAPMERARGRGRKVVAPAADLEADALEALLPDRR